MARSVRRTCIISMTTAPSEKRDKQLANRALRAAVRSALSRDAEWMPLSNDVSNTATMAKDGKFRFSALSRPELLRT